MVPARRLAAALAAGAALVAIPAPAAGSRTAEPVEIARVSDLTAGPVTAGRRIAWVEARRPCPVGGHVQCEVVVVSDGAQRRDLATLEGVGDIWDLAASSTTLAFDRAVTNPYEHERPTDAQTFGTVSPRGDVRRLLRCRYGARRCAEPPGPYEAGGVDVDGRRVAIGSGQRGEVDRLSVYDRGRLRTVVRMPAWLSGCCALFDLRGSLLAMSGYDRDVAVIDWRSGRLVRRVDTRRRSEPVVASLARGGVVVFTWGLNSRNHLVVSRPGRPLRELPRVLGHVAVAGDRIAAVLDDAESRWPFAVLGLGGRVLVRVPPTPGAALLGEQPHEFDGRCLVWAEAPAGAPPDGSGEVRILAADVAPRGERGCGPVARAR
jgi:hypothetical protein